MLEPLSPDNDPEDEGEMLPPRARILSIDPLSGSYNDKRVKYAFRSVENQKPSKKSRIQPTSSPVSPMRDDVFPDPGKKREIGTWEAAVDKVFHFGAREIDLKNCNLTSIPPQFISDLSKFVTLPNDNSRPLDDAYTVLAARPAAGRRGQIMRTRTAPASSSAGLPRVGQNEKSHSSSFLGAPKDGLDVYLSGNRIRELPQEVWRLHNLRVLSLRNNEISYLPPEISLLKNLVALNIADNKLKFVPSELMQMRKLTTLNLFPNPFIPEPPSTRPGRVVSETRRIGSRVPALAEIALRILLTRPITTGIDVPRTKLEQMYELPLPTGNVWRPISAHLRRTLAVCVPGSIADDGPSGSQDDPEFHEVTGVSVCPNPSHGSLKSIFIHHAEERYTWESEFPDIDSLGGRATVRWRGCQHGCLKFLDPEDNTASEVGVVETESMDVDEDQAVQPVVFGVGPLGFD